MLAITSIMKPRSSSRVSDYNSQMTLMTSKYIDIFSWDILYIIIFINCNWVVTRWQWLFYMYTKYELVTTKFKSGGLHEKHVVATRNLGNHLSICL